MDSIVAIDEDNMIAVAEARCSISKLQTELLKRRMFIHQPGTCSVFFIGSHFMHGITNKVNDRIDFPNRQIAGCEMVLGDGTILRKQYCEQVLYQITKCRDLYGLTDQDLI